MNSNSSWNLKTYTYYPNESTLDKKNNSPIPLDKYDKKKKTSDHKINHKLIKSNNDLKV